MTDSNLLLIIVAFIVAIAAIYALYSIILYQGNDKGDDLQISTKDILENVEVLFNQKAYNLVEVLASKYLDRVPGHNDVRIYLAKAFFEDKKYNLAIQQCGIILKKLPTNLVTRRLLGDCYVKKQLLGKAIKEYEYIIENKKDDTEVIRKLAELYRETEQLFSSIEAYNILTEYIDNDEEMAEVQTILAELNEEAHDYPAAFEAYKTKLGIHPKDITTNSNLVKLYIKIKNYPVAIETLLYMLSFAIEPKILLWIYETLVSLYEELEDYEKAIESSEKLLDIQGSDKFEVQNNIAKFKLKLNRTDEGIAILEELAMMSQNGFDVTIQLADAYIQSGEYEKALAKYLLLLEKATPKEAKTVNQLVCDLYILWATKCTEANKFEESYNHLREATQYNPINPEIYYNIALNNYKQKNFLTVVDMVNRALEYDKMKENNTKYLLLLAETHHELNNFFEEKKALMDLLKIDKNHPNGLYRIGLMYAAQHDIKNAEEALKKAILYDPELVPAKYNLALLYESNNRDRAKELYIEILEQDPTNEEAKNALAELSASEF